MPYSLCALGSERLLSLGQEGGRRPENGLLRRERSKKRRSLLGSDGAVTADTRDQTLLEGERSPLQTVAASHVYAQALKSSYDEARVLTCKVHLRGRHLFRSRTILLIAVMLSPEFEEFPHFSNQVWRA